jgi:succinate dehydrogenase / fumarate reductase cytochrome b subunit
MWAYAVNRITGIGLVVYLYLHLAVLSLLSRGPTAWDSFVSMARSPFYLSLDVILLAGILIHGLNGLRIALTGFDVGVRQQKMLFGVLMLGAAILLAVAALKIFGG